MGDEKNGPVVVWDFDGTLTLYFQPDGTETLPPHHEIDKSGETPKAIVHSWGVLRSFIKAVEDYTEAYQKGAITSEEWMRVNFEQAVPFLNEEILNEMYDALVFRNGYKEFISECKKISNDSPRILSGGFSPLVKKFAGEFGLLAYCPEYEVKDGKVKITRYINRQKKKEYLEGLMKEGYNVFYLADDYFKGAEPVESDFDKKYRDQIIRACLGPCNPNEHKLLILDFFEAIKILRQIKTKEDFENYKKLLNSQQSETNGYSCLL